MLALAALSGWAMLLSQAAFSAQPSGVATPDADPPHSADISKRNLTPEDFPRWQEIEPNVYAYEGLHSPDKAGVIVNTVSLIVITGDGVVVVDGQGDVPQTRLMIENIRKLTDEPIKYVVIASDHKDHTGGNSAFKDAFPNVVFIASPASKRRLANDPNPPTMLVSEQRSLRLGAAQIEILNLGRAHTGGDLVAWMPQQGVLFLGEIYLRDVFPAMRSAYPSEWVATLRKSVYLGATWYIPGHGFIDDAPTLRRELDEARQALVYVIDEAKRLHAAGFKCESAANCPAAAQANWGPYADWALRSSQAPLAIARVYLELDGKLPES